MRGAKHAPARLAYVDFLSSGSFFSLLYSSSLCVCGLCVFWKLELRADAKGAPPVARARSISYIQLSPCVGCLPDSPLS